MGGQEHPEKAQCQKIQNLSCTKTLPHLPICTEQKPKVGGFDDIFEKLPAEKTQKRRKQANL